MRAPPAAFPLVFPGRRRYAAGHSPSPCRAAAQSMQKPQKQTRKGFQFMKVERELAWKAFDARLCGKRFSGAPDVVDI
jgi:hypothetical protein